ncbi:MAG: hypothetical protein RIS70_2347, partial [Planctomycetota bacterium]
MRPSRDTHRRTARIVEPLASFVGGTSATRTLLEASRFPEDVSAQIPAGTDPRWQENMLAIAPACNLTPLAVRLFYRDHLFSLFRANGPLSAKSLFFPSPEFTTIRLEI